MTTTDIRDTIVYYENIWTWKCSAPIGEADRTISASTKISRRIEFHSTRCKLQVFFSETQEHNLSEIYIKCVNILQGVLNISVS